MKKNKTLIIAVVISTFVYSLYSCEPGKPGSSGTADTVAVKDTSVKRGAYLVMTMGCNDCHSPKIMGLHGPELDTTRLMSGHPANEPFNVTDLQDVKKGSMIASPGVTAFVGPWGKTFAANLTSDGTGIGNWSFGQFKKAITQGKFMGIDEERMIMPPMPWQNYTQLKDEDIKAIFAYLKSTKPVRNMVPALIPADKMAK